MINNKVNKKKKNLDTVFIMTLLDHLPSKYPRVHFFYILCDVNSNSSSFIENQFFHTTYSDYAFLFPQPLPVSSYFQKIMIT